MCAACLRFQGATRSPRCSVMPRLLCCVSAVPLSSVSPQEGKLASQKVQCWHRTDWPLGPIYKHLRCLKLQRACCQCGVFRMGLSSMYCVSAVCLRWCTLCRHGVLRIWVKSLCVYDYSDSITSSWQIVFEFLHWNFFYHFSIYSLRNQNCTVKMVHLPPHLLIS